MDRRRQCPLIRTKGFLGDLALVKLIAPSRCSDGAVRPERDVINPAMFCVGGEDASRAKCVVTTSRHRRRQDGAAIAHIK
jgi:hypothetical protein